MFSGFLFACIISVFFFQPIKSHALIEESKTIVAANCKGKGACAVQVGDKTLTADYALKKVITE